MAEFLESISLFPLVLTLGTYQIGLWCNRKTKSALCNPLLISAILCVLVLGVLGFDPQVYQKGVSGISWLLTPATICYHLKKLEAAGVVNCARSQFYIIYSLNRDIFDRPLYELIKKDEPVCPPEEKYKKEVISQFFKYGRLTQIPTQRKKREIVLAEIAKDFELGRTYDEGEVNEIIHKYHEDHCTIRREMIACGLMQREHETYWKVGDT